MKFYQFLRLLRQTEYLVLASDSGEILDCGFDPLDLEGLEGIAEWEVVGLQTVDANYCLWLDPEGSYGTTRGLYVVLKRPVT